MFNIPAYQRRYSWLEAQCLDLWNNVLAIAEHRRAVQVLKRERPGDEFVQLLKPSTATHFAGMILLKPTDHFFSLVRADGAPEGDPYHMFDVVDGQQRLTTFTIFMSVIARQWIELDAPDKAVKIMETYLYVLLERGEQKLLRLSVPEEDREYFEKLINPFFSLEDLPDTSEFRFKNALDLMHNAAIL